MTFEFSILAPERGNSSCQAVREQGIFVSRSFLVWFNAGLRNELAVHERMMPFDETCRLAARVARESQR
jgi:hypothetical protein